MNLLAIDTSTKYLSVAVAEGEDVLASFCDEGKLQHATLLIPVIEKILKKCNLKLKDIGALALSIGPGSFTGLRIGVATVKGINLALGIPIVAVPTLDAIAHNFINEKKNLLCPMIDAKKGKVYACLYDKQKRLTDYMLADTDSVLARVNGPALVFGDGAELYKKQCEKNPLVTISTKNWFPKAEVIAKLGLQKAKKRKFASPDKLVPMYLHSQYCQIKNVK